MSARNIIGKIKLNRFYTYISSRIEALLSDRNGFALNLSLLSTSNLIARVFAGLSQAFIGRAVGVSLYGAFASSLAMSRLLSIFFSLGLDLWLLKTSSTKDKQDIPKINGLVIFWKLSTGPVWILLITFLATYLNQESYPQNIVFLCAALVWFEEIFRSTIFINEVNSGIKQAAILTISVQSAIIVLISLFKFYFDLGSIDPYLYGYLAVYVIGCMISIYLVNANYGLVFKLKGIIAALKEAFEYAISTALALTYGKIDITLANNWLGNTASGQYSPSLNIAQAFSIIPNSAHGILFRRFGTAFSGSSAYLQKEYRRVFLIMAGGGLAIAIAIAPFTSFIIRLLYGPEFELSGRILSVLVFIIPLRFISVTSGVLLTTINWHRKRIYVQIIAVLLNLGLNLWVLFMTDFGVMGIAVVYLITEIFLASGYGSMTQFYFMTVKSEK